MLFRPKKGFGPEKLFHADGIFHQHSNRWLKPTAKDIATNEQLS
jgi:hypothetical protein